MQKAEYSVSIIIPTMNRPLELAVCLDSISKQSLRPKQTIVIEAGKEDLSENMLREKYPEVLFLRFPESSLTSARNRAIKDAEGDIVIFLDDDIILEPGFVYAMTEVFKIKGLSSIGGVCGNITNQISGSEKWMHRLILKAFFMGESGSGKFKISGAPTFVYGSNRVKEVEFIPGGITAYRRSLFDEFLFDEKLKGYCYGEDADFSYRISRKYKNYYTPDARAFHKHTATGRSRGAKALWSFMEATWHRSKKNLKPYQMPFAAIYIFGMLVEALYLKAISYLSIPIARRY